MDPLDADRNGITAVHSFAVRNMMDDLRTAVVAGADVNAVTTVHKETALHMVCASGGLESALLLLELGADWLKTDAAGLTPLCVAMKKYELDICFAMVRRVGFDPAAENMLNDVSQTGLGRQVLAPLIELRKTYDRQCFARLMYSHNKNANMVEGEVRTFAECALSCETICRGIAAFL